MKKTVLPTREPLVGRFVRLSLLGEVDLKELYPLLAEREVYASGYVMHRRPVSLEDGRDLARERFLRQQGQADGNGAGRTAYAVRLAVCSELGEADTLVGTSALMEANLHHESIHLGSTLYGRRWWGTRVNPEVKLLLLKHCFEECGYGRVKIQTDTLNTRSQAAISKLGATWEGVTRRDMRREDGTFRDSVVFSILKSEWPEVKTGLQARLDAPTPST
jgi:RimJ/RimL family protein N-acetyltransferase